MQAGIFYTDEWKSAQCFINTLIVDGRPKCQSDTFLINKCPQMGAVNITVFLTTCLRMWQLLK